MASSKYQKLGSRKDSKTAAKQHERAPSSESSGEESGSECEQRPPTPTKSKSSTSIVMVRALILLAPKLIVDIIDH